MISWYIKIMSKLSFLKNNLKRGRVYRRKELEQWSSSVDRHLQELLDMGVLVKLSGGLYAYPRQSEFGAILPDDKVILSAFLKGDKFLIISPNQYNSLNMGTTQLYNKTVIYNRRRHDPAVSLGKRQFDFRKKRDFPNKLTREFLLVDLVDNVATLAEDTHKVLKTVTNKISEFNVKEVSMMAQKYASPTTQNFFAQALV